MSEIALSVRDLTKHYEGGLVKALNGVSLTVREGGMISIMGPSGCGKSTLLNLVGALDVPTSGSIEVFGRDLALHAPWSAFRAKTVGFVFQLSHLIPTITLLENVELPLYSLNVSRVERRERAVALLASVGLAGRMGFLPPRVSGGERQRAAIARALVNNPRIILADEPTGSVDSRTGAMILDFLVGHCREKPVTMLIATHNPDVAARTDSVLFMEDGRLKPPPGD